MVGNQFRSSHLKVRIHILDEVERPKANLPAETWWACCPSSANQKAEIERIDPLTVERSFGKSQIHSDPSYKSEISDPRIKVV